MEIKEVKPGVEAFLVIECHSKEEWPIVTIKTVAYQIGDSGWICNLENGDVVPINKLIKLD